MLKDRSFEGLIKKHEKCNEWHLSFYHEKAQPFYADKESEAVTVFICHRLIVPNVRQTFKGRFSPRAKRYNDDQVGLKQALDYEIQLHNIINKEKPFVMFDKSWDLSLFVGFYMHREGRRNNIKVIDIDNLQKSIQDALQGRIFYNDNKISKATAFKTENDFNFTIINIIGDRLK